MSLSICCFQVVFDVHPRFSNSRLWLYKALSTHYFQAVALGWTCGNKQQFSLERWIVFSRVTICLFLQNGTCFNMPKWICKSMKTNHWSIMFCICVHIWLKYGSLLKHQKIGIVKGDRNCWNYCLHGNLTNKSWKVLQTIDTRTKWSQGPQE
jgi:hypothetical protein